jgi:hypothetical protein
MVKLRVIIFGAVEKVLSFSLTPIPIAIGTPRGDFLVIRGFQFPPWGVRG